MDEKEKNEQKMSSADEGSLKCKRLKKTLKDKCLVIGETTMYYGNFGSVQVWSPIPGSPNLDNETERIDTRPDSPKEAASSCQLEVQAAPKKSKGKKRTSEKKKSAQTDEKNDCPKYTLAPLKATPASVINAQRPPQVPRGREPCHFTPTRDIRCVGSDMFRDEWIPQPGFKPSETKTMPRNKFTAAESSNLRYGSLGRLLESTSSVQTSSHNTASLGSVRLPAIRGASGTPEPSRQTPTPSAQYINIHKDNAQLPPLKVRSVTTTDKAFDREYQKLTKGYQK